MKKVHQTISPLQQLLAACFPAEQIRLEAVRHREALEQIEPRTAEVQEAIDATQEFIDQFPDLEEITTWSTK